MGRENKPRVRVTRGEVEGMLNERVDEVQDTVASMMNKYHFEVVVPMLDRSMRTIRPKLPWWKRWKMAFDVKKAVKKAAERVA